MTDEVLVHNSDKVLRLTLNRPERKNAINLAMYTRLTEALLAAYDDGTRVVVIAGASGCFTSGNDLGDFANNSSLMEKDNPITRFISAVFQCPIPIVAAVDGVAVGIGTTILLHSDLVYSSESAQYRLPFANLGLCPEFASSYVLPAVAGFAKASEWLMLGEFFSAADAHHAGIVNEIVDDPLATALAQADKLVKQPPAALRQVKALMKAPHKAAIEKVLQDEFKAFGSALKGPEFAEAAVAFFEKRAPDFSSF